MLPSIWPGSYDQAEDCDFPGGSVVSARFAGLFSRIYSSSQPSTCVREVGAALSVEISATR